MMRRSLAWLEKLVIVESPNKVIKIEGILSNPRVLSDWSFGDADLASISTGPEKAIAMATTGHFMALKELSWTPQATSVPSTKHQDFPPNGVMASFALEWEILPGRRIRDTVSHYIEEKADNITEIIVATDPDREGELIAAHSVNLIRHMFPKLKIPFSRAYMHSITEEGVCNAMRERRTLFDHNLANAAEARHAMDRIFGFLGSSVVRYANPQMRSIGRVQTPALILIHDREERIKRFIETHKSTFEVRTMCSFTSKQGLRFSQIAAVVPLSMEGDKTDWSSEASVKERCQQWNLSAARDFRVDEVAKPQSTTTEAPLPFTMATLIAKANRQLHFTSDVTSSCLQDLFQMGHITYPRTDSTRIDETALQGIYSAIRKEYGKDMVQESKEGPRKSAKKKAPSKKTSQQEGNVEDAHEAIRPTNINVKVDDLGSVSQYTKSVYDLIRRNTLAAFMTPLKTERVSVVVGCKAANGDEVCFQLQGKHIVDAGWSAAFRGEGAAASVLGETEQDVQAMENGDAIVPSISDDEFKALLEMKAQLGAKSGVKSPVELTSTQVSENRPSPPLPYSEGGLIEELKNNGVGRPSTYPMIVKTLLARNYIVINKGRCETTPVGRLLVETSRNTFPSIVDIGFTSAFEKKLDRIAKPESSDNEFLRQHKNFSEADFVLSSFVANFLNYVTEATRAQRTAITERSLTLQQEAKGAAKDAAFADHVEKEKKRVSALVPDLVGNVKNYRTFTALQNSMTDFLRTNFPLAPGTQTRAPYSGGGGSSTYRKPSSTYSSSSTKKNVPRRFRPKKAKK